MMNSSEINSRETYLKFRKEWRNVYKALTSEIRAVKKIAREPEDSVGKQARAQSNLHYLRVRARAMMAELEEAKGKRPLRLQEKVAA